MVSSEEHPENTSLPIFVTEDGILIDVMLSQFLKASSAILITCDSAIDEGISIEPCALESKSVTVTTSSSI